MADYLGGLQNAGKFALGGTGGIFGLGLNAANQAAPGMMSSAKNFLAGQPSGIEAINKYSPSQQGIKSNVLNMGYEGLQNPTAGFAPIRQEAERRYNQQTLPSLAERFTQSGGLTSSPSFLQQLGSSNADFSSQLAALEAQYGLQNRGQLLDMLRIGLDPEQQHYQVEGQGGLLQQLLPVLGRLGLHAGTAAATGGWSAIPSALYELSQLWSGKDPSKTVNPIGGQK